MICAQLLSFVVQRFARITWIYKISLLKLGVIQSQAGLHKEQMMREELVKDDAQFGEDLEESENKIEIVNRNSNRTDNTRDYFDHQYEIEESNSRKSFVEEKLESIFEDEKEKEKQVDNSEGTEGSRTYSTQNVSLVEKAGGGENLKNLPCFEEDLKSDESNLRTGQKLTKGDVCHKTEEELVYKREGALAQAVIFITRQLITSPLILSCEPISFVTNPTIATWSGHKCTSRRSPQGFEILIHAALRHDSVLRERAGGRRAS